jgi:LysM repeat protein
LLTNLFSHLCNENLYLMKRLLILLFCLPLTVLAQNAPLVVEGASPNLYLTHTVKAKENYYSIGRMYNISPKEIAPFNNLSLEKGLTLNQVIKVPLTDVNFLQAGNAPSDEVLVPVYHIVKDKEGLYRIATNAKVALENLKQWNNIKTDAVANGTHLIVGYLKVKPALSVLSSMAKSKPADLAVTAPPVTKTEPAVVKATEPVKKEAVIVKEPVATPAVVKKDPPPVVKEAEPVAQPVVTAGKNFNGGSFKTNFDKQVKPNPVTESGSGAVFKSNSGWQDGKYYCLHNTAAPGTIIKVTSSTTGKSIYAKVLDVIPDIKQNSGLLIRISNAAAQELGLGETKFDCTLSYSK